MSTYTKLHCSDAGRSLVSMLRVQVEKGKMPDGFLLGKFGIRVLSTET